MKNILNKPKVKRSMFSLKIRDDLQEDLRMKKLKDGQTLTYLVEMILEEYLKRKG